MEVLSERERKRMIIHPAGELIDFETVFEENTRLTEKTDKCGHFERVEYTTDACKSFEQEEI